MRKILLSAAAVTMLFTACKKKDDNGTGNGLGKNQWKVGSTTYNSLGVSGAMGLIVASGTNGGTELSTFTVGFANNAYPTSGGQFNIVDVANDPNELSVNVGTSNTGGNSQAWGSSASGNPQATVTVDGGKVTVSIPQITVTGASSSSTTFSGNVTQN